MTNDEILLKSVDSYREGIQNKLDELEPILESVADYIRFFANEALTWQNKAVEVACLLDKARDEVIEEHCKKILARAAQNKSAKFKTSTLVTQRYLTATAMALIQRAYRHNGNIVGRTPNQLAILKHGKSMRHAYVNIGRKVPNA